MRKSLLNWATTLLVVGAMALPTFAAGGGAGGAGGAGGGRGGRGGRGAGGAGGGGGFGFNADPAAQIQTRLTAIRTSLNVTADDEWSVLSAKIQKVLEAKQKLAPGMPNALGFGGFGGGRGGRGGGGGAGGAAAAAPADTSNPLAVAVSDLTTATAAGTTTADADLKAKLKTLRDARMGATKNVTDAQADLAKIVTVRQEAILVTLGVLD